MNRINGADHQFTHFKPVNRNNCSNQFFRSKGSSNSLPSIANLNSALRHEDHPSSSSCSLFPSSFSSFVTSDSFYTPHLNDVLLPSVTMVSNPLPPGHYPSLAPVSHQYSHPVYFSSSTAAAVTHSQSSSYFSGGPPQQMCDPPDLGYRYPSYSSFIPRRDWSQSSYHHNQGPPPGPLMTPSFLSSAPSLQMSTDLLNLDHISPSASCPSNGTLDKAVVASGKRTTVLKDERYILRRTKNNIAAKKCRDNKKQKSNELCTLAVNYEHENLELRKEIEALKTRISELKMK